MKYEIDIPEEMLVGIDGEKYEPTGEFRNPKLGECFINYTYASAQAANFDFHTPRIILRPRQKPWRAATKADVGKWGKIAPGARKTELLIWVNDGDPRGLPFKSICDRGVTDSHLHFYVQD